MNTMRLVIAAGLLAATVEKVQAGIVIPSLFNTGVDNSGSPLLDGTLGDPHYSLFAPGGTNATIVRTESGGYPIPPYLGDDTLSAWIGPANSYDMLGPIGYYFYRTTFDLTGFDSNTASINGRWSSDNNGVGIFLNGRRVSYGTDYEQFQSWSSFTATSGFVGGINRLDFIVFNGGIQTGLRVEMVGTAGLDVPPAPEPTSLALAGFAGLGMALGAWRRRRQHKQQAA